MGELCAQAMITLAYEYEIFCQLVIPTRVAPFETTALFDSVNTSSNLVIVEEGGKTLGWGAEVAALTAEGLGSRLKSVNRVAARQTPIPAAPSLEVHTLPQVADIVNAVRKQVG
jgi:pyruvate/2-oxoglutarate/acetoin dehydrogenase E1 component